MFTPLIELLHISYNQNQGDVNIGSPYSAIFVQHLMRDSLPHIKEAVIMQIGKTHGSVEILLESYLREHGISKNQASRSANMTRTRLNAYCKNAVQRVDLDVLARLCDVLNCEVGELLRYVPKES